MVRISGVINILLFYRIVSVLWSIELISGGRGIGHTALKKKNIEIQCLCTVQLYCGSHDDQTAFCIRLLFSSNLALFIMMVNVLRECETRQRTLKMNEWIAQWMNLKICYIWINCN